MAWKNLSSGKLSTSQIVYTGPCFYFGFACRNAKTSFTITMYDNTAASGLEIEDYQTDANKEMEGHVHNSPITCRNGIYLELGGGSAIVYYSPLREGVQ
jgi:hypothetical protein